MVTVFSPNYPGTQFGLKAKQVETAPGSFAYELSAEVHGSGVTSRPKRYKEIGEIATVLTEATDIDAEEVRAFIGLFGERGLAEIPEVWLLDEQAARFGVHINSGFERHTLRIR
jgi:hypothetical protein